MAIFDKSNFEVSTVDGVSKFTYKDKDVYKNGTEIPFKVLKEVADYNNQFVNEAVELSAQLAKEHMKKEKNVTESIFDFGFSPSKRGKLTVDIHREKDVRNVKTGEVEKRSRIRVISKDPALKFSGSRLKELSKDLTDTLI